MYTTTVPLIILIVLLHNIEAFSVLTVYIERRVSLPVNTVLKSYGTHNMKSNDEGDDEGTKIDDGNKKEVGRDIFFIQEPKLLVGDLISMLLTCQLLGLVDVLNNPDFWMNGGFAQPIDLSPKGVSSLGTLVRRDSIMSISWVLSAIKNKAYSFSAVADDLTAIKCALTILTDYCSLLIILTLALAFTNESPVDGYEILRQSYFTILIIGAFRVVYGRLALYL